MEKVNPDLVLHDANGEPYSVRYEQINAMLLNEFLKEHKKVEDQARQIREQKGTISELKNGMAVLTAQLKEQAAQIQKVSAQIETGKPTARLVNNRVPKPPQRVFVSARP